MKVRNRRTGTVIEVPSKHYENVLARQGVYLPVEENEENVETVSKGSAGDSGEQEQAAQEPSNQRVRKRRGQAARKHQERQVEIK